MSRTPRPRSGGQSGRKSAQYLLGQQDRRGTLQRLSFGKFKIPLTSAEFAAITAAAEQYLHRVGSLYGFARELLR